MNKRGRESSFGLDREQYQVEVEEEDHQKQGLEFFREEGANERRTTATIGWSPSVLSRRGLTVA